jgi:hypothetical protein
MRIIQIATAALAATIGGAFLRREWRRINRELEAVRAREGKGAPVLRQDRRSGEWRPS